MTPSGVKQRLRGETLAASKGAKALRVDGDDWQEFWRGIQQGPHAREQAPDGNQMMR
jgi:hypothetical protein